MLIGPGGSPCDGTWLADELAGLDKAWSVSRIALSKSMELGGRGCERGNRIAKPRGVMCSRAVEETAYQAPGRRPQTRTARKHLATDLAGWKTTPGRRAHAVTEEDGAPTNDTVGMLYSDLSAPTEVVLFVFCFNYI